MMCTQRWKTKYCQIKECFVVVIIIVCTQYHCNCLQELLPSSLTDTLKETLDGLRTWHVYTLHTCMVCEITKYFPQIRRICIPRILIVSMVYNRSISSIKLKILTQKAIYIYRQQCFKSSPNDNSSLYISIQMQFNGKSN